jgi:glycosyltransferase involved in cell wall biosynthesis
MTRVAMFVTSTLIHDNRVRREAETLASAGNEVTVFSHIASTDVSQLGWEAQSGLRAVPVTPLDFRRKRHPGRAWAAARNLWQWGGSQHLHEAARAYQAGVYHAHDLDTLAVAARLAQRDGARLVYDSHELFLARMNRRPGAPMSRRERVRSRIFRLNWARLERALIGRADTVITVSQSIAEELATLYDIRPPVVILNTPRYRDLSRGSATLRKRLGLSAEQRIVLSQGGVMPGRGQLELVASLTLLPEHWHLVFLGFNLGNYQGEILREVERLGLRARVHTLDALPPERLLDATASADLGVVLLTPTNKNSLLAMPNKLFEYVMAGVPFVANDLPEIGKVARMTGAGFTVPSITPEAIASGVREVLDNRACWRAMRQSALDAARNEYNWERQAEHLLEAYSRFN